MRYEQLGELYFDIRVLFFIIWLLDEVVYFSLDVLIYHFVKESLILDNEHLNSVYWSAYISHRNCGEILYKKLCTNKLTNFSVVIDKLHAW